MGEFSDRARRQYSPITKWELIKEKNKKKKRGDIFCERHRRISGKKRLVKKSEEDRIKFTALGFFSEQNMKIGE